MRVSRMLHGMNQRRCNARSSICAFGYRVAGCPKMGSEQRALWRNDDPDRLDSRLQVSGCSRYNGIATWQGLQEFVLAACGIEALSLTCGKKDAGICRLIFAGFHAVP